jgi:outer membrane immunogenic protein
LQRTRGTPMKKIILAAALASIGSTVAMAADLGAPDVKAAQVYNWTGIYFGGDVGVAGVAHNFNSNFSQQDSSPAFANNVQDNPFSSTPFIGGGHAGFNWQFTPSLVAGVEGDWQSVRSRQSFCRQTDIGSIACLDGNENNRGFASASGGLDWVATARGRVGWATGPLMIYGTGGAAFAKIESSAGLSCSDAGCGDSGNVLVAATSSSTQKTGWVVGAGVEWMFAPNWIVRGEYQHIDLGSVSSALSPAGCDSFNCNFSATQNVRLDVLRAGVSFKFGG